MNNANNGNFQALIATNSSEANSIQLDSARRRRNKAMIQARGHQMNHARNPSGSVQTNELISAAEHNDTSHEMIEDVLD